MTITNFDVSFKPTIKNPFAEFLTELTTTLELHYQMREILLDMPLQSYHLAIADSESFAAR